MNACLFHVNTHRWIESVGDQIYVTKNKSTLCTLYLLLDTGRGGEELRKERGNLKHDSKIKHEHIVYYLE